MTALPTAFRSAPGKYNFVGTTELVNAYAEQNGADAKGAMSVLPSEGLVEFADTDAGPCRGLIYMEDLEVGFSVHSSSVHQINSDGTTLRLGTVPGVDPVQLSRNQNASPQVTIRSNAGLQVLESSSVGFVLDEDLPASPVTQDYAGGHTCVGYEDRTWFTSSINQSKEYDSLDFATFEQRSGKLIRMKEHSGEMFGFCSSWYEAWRKVNDPDFPFSPIAFKPRGLKAAHAVVSSDNTLIFPGDDNTIGRLVNYDYQVISTHEVARLLQNDIAGADISGFGYDREGHAFAVFTGTNWTRTYDSATKVWHSRKSYGYDRWNANHSMRAFGKTILGSRTSGKLYYLDKDTFTEDGEPLVWQVISPPMHAFPNGGIVNALHMDLATGYGTLSGTGSDPKVMLETSTDGGNTFTQYRELELGATGKYATRVTARRLGRFGPKGMVFRISISDPVVRALVGIDADVKGLKR